MERNKKIKLYEYDEVLDLKFNSIDDVGIYNLMNDIKTDNLKELWLGSNSIGDEGVKAIAEYLKYNTTLQILSLGANNIGEIGASYLADALENNNTIMKLFLSYNKIGDKGATALLKSLNKNYSLQILAVHDNNIQDKSLIVKISEILSDEIRMKRQCTMVQNKSVILLP